MREPGERDLQLHRVARVHVGVVVDGAVCDHAHAVTHAPIFVPERPVRPTAWEVLFVEAAIEHEPLR